MAQDSGEGAPNVDLLEGLRETLLREAEMPPREVKGVSDEFLAGRLADLQQVAAWTTDVRCRVRC